MRELGVELIHSHDPGTMGLKAIPISRYLKIPHVHTYHTFWPEYVHYIPLGSRYTKMTAERFSALFCNRCDGIIAPTRKIQDALRQYGTRVPVKIIPTGIRTDGFSASAGPELHQKYSIPAQRKILVYAGRIAKEKNVPFLLDMMDEIVHKMRRTATTCFWWETDRPGKNLKNGPQRTGFPLISALRDSGLTGR